MASQLTNRHYCVRHCRCVPELSSIVNNVLANDWMADFTVAFTIVTSMRIKLNYIQGISQRHVNEVFIGIEVCD